MQQDFKLKKWQKFNRQKLKEKQKDKLQDNSKGINKYNISMTRSLQFSNRCKRFKKWSKLNKEKVLLFRIDLNNNNKTIKMDSFKVSKIFCVVHPLLGRIILDNNNKMLPSNKIDDSINCHINSLQNFMHISQTNSYERQYSISNKLKFHDSESIFFIQKLY